MSESSSDNDNNDLEYPDDDEEEEEFPLAEEVKKRQRRTAADQVLLPNTTHKIPWGPTWDERHLCDTHDGAVCTVIQELEDYYTQAANKPAYEKDNIRFYYLNKDVLRVLARWQLFWYIGRKSENSYQALLDIFHNR